MGSIGGGGAGEGHLTSNSVTLLQTFCMIIVFIDQPHIGREDQLT